MTLILGIAGSFIAITGFAVLLETPRKYVPLAGLAGAIGGGIYLYCTQSEIDVVLYLDSDILCLDTFHELFEIL